MKPGTEADIGTGGEAEWQRLRRQVELAEGFWLGFIFSPSPLSSGVLRRRTERLLRAQTRKLESIDPKHPSALGSVLPTLFTPEKALAGCIWIEALNLDPDDGAARPWREAWLELISRMNERRDALRRHLHGGLVIVAAPSIKPFIRESASDLWSIRALVVELPPVEEDTPDGTSLNQEFFSAQTFSEERPETKSITEFTVTESERLLNKSSEDAANKTNILLSRTTALLSTGRTGEAVEAARQAQELAFNTSRGAPRLQALTLQTLADAEKAHGDLAAAEEHLKQAIKILKGPDTAYRIPLLDKLAELALWQRDLSLALATYEESLVITRQLRVQTGDEPELLRHLSTCLINVGTVHQRLGNLSLANKAYEESLSLTRQLRATLGETPQTLRDLCESLTREGSLQKRLGNFSTANALYEESLGLARQLRIIPGDTVEALTNLSILLNQVGSMHLRLGDFASAGSKYEESIELRRQLCATLGNTPETLGYLTVPLDGLGQARTHLGDFPAAFAAHDEALSVYRQIRAMRGDAPLTLSDLSIALERVADAQANLSNFSAAITAYEEALSLRRQLRAVLGGTSETIAHIGSALHRLSRLHLYLRNFSAASTFSEETLMTARELNDLVEDNPTSIAVLVESLESVANTRELIGDSDGAARAREEVRAIHLKLKK